MANLYSLPTKKVPAYGTPGDWYFVTDTGVLWLVSDNGTLVEMTHVLGLLNIKGEAGPQGDQGIPGNQGIQGVQGIQGPPGIVPNPIDAGTF